MRTGIFCATVYLVVSVACTSDESPEVEQGAVEVEADSSPVALNDEGEWFVDRAADVGLTFVHFNGASGDFLYPEILPPGVGLFAYDNDGDLDAFIVQGHMLGEGKTVADALMERSTESPLTGRLYRNDLTEGASSLRFVDVTESSGLVADGYGLGVTTGDVDNDGWIDLFVTNFGPDQLFHNNGDGTFTDISSHTGIEERNLFGVSASFVDYDRDDWLDLYVGNNVDYDLSNRTECPNPAGNRDYCSPQIYGGLPDRLYRNRGDGTFDDVSATALLHDVDLGISRSTSGQFGPALGVVAADYNGDTWPDIYVANDGSENILWLNQQDGTFSNAALLSGAALSALGTPEASMGVTAGDYDNDGDEDLFMTHLMTEGNNLYVNNGSGVFQDGSAPSGLGPASLSYTGWGTQLFDFDNDGWLDLLAINGAVIAGEGRAGNSFPYDQRKSLFRNLGTGRFEDVSDRAGSVFTLSEVGRGAAFGDVDNDGDVDVLVGNNTGPIRLLINAVGNHHHWLGLRLVGAIGDAASVQSRDMVGARVAVVRAGMPTQWRRVHTDGSYASASDPRVVFGLGESTESLQVRVVWPNGQVEVWSDVEIDRYATLTQGQGDAR